MDRWARIEQAPDYEVSTSGEVRRAVFRVTRAVGPVRPFVDRDGYRRVALWVRTGSDRDRKKFKVARLVALAFLGAPSARDQVNHRNWIRSDDRLENLEWASPVKNSRHRKVRPTPRLTSDPGKAHGSAHGHAKLDEADVAAIRAQHARGDTQTVIAAAHGVTRSLVSMIVNRKVWTHVA